MAIRELQLATSTEMSETKSRNVLAIAAATVATGVLAYVVYFDYKRRNDAQFRRKLREYIQTLPVTLTIYIPRLKARRKSASTRAWPRKRVHLLLAVARPRAMSPQKCCGRHWNKSSMRTFRLLLRRRNPTS